ncbi:MAG: right-handed parallel beta-helix repeat-containing protein [Candidatus Nomurabacteria bacterium]|nr:MAG: right-handed parallel beta-helix repeat-containing protein [Candidatus Nomurabacteria bacterium]
MHAKNVQDVYVGHLAVDGNKGNQSGGTNYGVHLYVTGSSTIEGVYSYNMHSVGIRAESSYYNTITNNIVRNNIDSGITSDGSNTIINNFSSDNGTGIRVVVGGRELVTNNRIYDNTTGISVTGSANTISNNYVYSNTDGLKIGTLADWNTVSGNKFELNSNYGIYIDPSYYNKLTDNLLLGNGYGIYTSTALELVVASNEIRGNTTAIYLSNGGITGAGSKVTNNYISDNGGTGATSSIKLVNEDNALISGNRIYDTAGSGYAIDIDAASSNVTLADNVYSGTGATAIRDLSSNTEYTEHNRITVNATDSDFASGAYTALKITQSGTGDIANFFDGSNEVLTILDGGNVGIGTTSPSSKLEVNGNITLSSAGGKKITTPGDELILENTGDTFGTVQLLLRNRNGANGALFNNLSLDLVDFGFKGNSGYQSNIRYEHRSGYILGGSDNSVGEFQLIDDVAGTPNYMFTVNKNASVFHSGNIGIGTSSPNSKLTIAGNTNVSSYTNLPGYFINSMPAVTGSTTLNNFFFAGATSSSFYLGSHNYAMGNGALTNLGQGSYNFAVGGNALAGSSTAGMHGSSNIALGYSTLFSNVWGEHNNALGNEALYSNTNGGGNNALGYQALRYSTTGGANNALGYQALFSNVTGHRNNALGYQTLFYNTTGADNNAIGDSALFVNSIGSRNNALGYNTIFNNTVGSDNNAIGHNALYSNTTGSRNNALGYHTLYSNNGTGTIAIGYQTADNALSVDRSIFIGYNIDAFSTTADDQLNIGNLIFGNNVNGTGQTISSGNIGIATTSSTARLTVQSTGTSDILNLFETGGSEVFTVLESGNVGIGANNPDARFVIKGEDGGGQPSFLKILDETDSIKFQINQYGNFIANAGGYFSGSAGTAPHSAAVAVNPSASSKAISIKEASGQTSNTFEIIDNSENSLFAVAAGGNVGLGTTTPTALLTVGSSTPTAIPVANQYNSAYISGLLEVGGTGTSTFAGTLDINGTATSTFANGIELEGGCFRDQSGTCISAQGDTQIVVAANDTDVNLKAYADYVADGTNDQDEIQSAIDYVYANGGGTVHLLAGTFTVGTTTYTDSAIRLATSTQLVGQGDATVIKLRNSFNANISIVHAYNVQDVYVGHLAVDGNKANQSGGTDYGVNLQNTGSSTVENTYVHSLFYYGINVQGNNNNVVSNTVHNNQLRGIQLTGSYNTASHNMISDNGSWGIFVDGSMSNVTNNIIKNNPTGIRVNASSNTISGNQISQSTTYGIDLSSSASYNIINSNDIIVNAGIGIYLNLVTGYNTISGNNVYFNGYGIYLNTSANNTVTANNFSENSYGIYGTCFACVLNANTLTGNDTAIYLVNGD